MISRIEVPVYKDLKYYFIKARDIVFGLTKIRTGWQTPY